MADGYRDLAVWQKSMSLVTQIYLITKSFPKDELYSLTNQMRRAATSIPCNIAESKAKRASKEFARFLLIARGSVAELETQLLISQNLSYVSEKQIQSLLNDASEVGRMLSGLISKLDAAKS